MPSLDAWVSLVSDIEGDEILIAADWWKAIVAVGSGASVATVGHALKLGELDVCRQVKQLVERSLVRVSTTPMPTLTTLDPTPWETNGSSGSNGSNGANGSNGSTGSNDSSDRPAATWDPFAVDVPKAVVSDDDVDLDAPAPSVDAEPAFGHYAAEGEIADDDDPEVDADEVAKQLASLSPRAAQAVAAAAHATTDEERDAALAQAAAEEDEPINRGLLLKFLSSVKS